MKTIIEMAREAGLEEMWELTPRFIGRLEAFAALVAAAEREACAEVAEMTPCQFDDYKRIAAAIRARGEHMKTIIEMAREANAMHNIIEEWVTFDYTELERFAALVRADERDRAMRENAYVLAEREACTKVCEAFGEMGLGVNSAAAAIRARGNT